MPDDPPPADYDALLRAAGAVAAQALDRVRRLHARFPCDIPGGVLAQLEGVRDDRRGAVRLGAGGKAGVGAGAMAACPVRDRSAGGLALRLADPVGVGDALRVAVEGRVLMAVVRHCRQDPGGGWVAGCEVVGELARTN